MIERMDEFFKARVDGYDEHMLANIEGADEFYAYTASLLPDTPESKVLDLGCGTGLELEEYFKMNPQAQVTGIDLSEDMLGRLSEKFKDKDIRLICASYFDTPLGEKEYDAAVSVESLHHFTEEQKLGLYTKLHGALKDKGYFVLTDYFAESEEQETDLFEQLASIKRLEGIGDDEFYHFDTPMTVQHEMDILTKAGFSEIKIKKSWSVTYTIIAYR